MAITSAGADQQLRRESGPQTNRGVARRAELLAAARKVFEDKGYTHARVTDIAAELPVAVGTFYTYFADKEEIFTEVAELVVEDITTSMHGQHESGTVVGRVYENNRRFLVAYRRNARILRLIEQQATASPGMRDLRLKMRTGFVEPAARALRRLQAEGLADETLPPKLTAQILGAMIDEVCYLWLILGEDLGDEETVLRTMSRLWAQAAGIDVSAAEPHRLPRESAPAQQAAAGQT